MRKRVEEMTEFAAGELLVGSVVRLPDGRVGHLTQPGPKTKKRGRVVVLFPGQDLPEELAREDRVTLLYGPTQLGALSAAQMTGHRIRPDLEAEYHRETIRDLVDQLHAERRERTEAEATADALQMKTARLARLAEQGLQAAKTHEERATRAERCWVDAEEKAATLATTLRAERSTRALSDAGPTTYGAVVQHLRAMVKEREVALAAFLGLHTVAMGGESEDGEFAACGCAACVRARDLLDHGADLLAALERTARATAPEVTPEEAEEKVAV